MSACVEKLSLTPLVSAGTSVYGWELSLDDSLVEPVDTSGLTVDIASVSATKEGLSVLLSVLDVVDSISVLEDASVEVSSLSVEETASASVEPSAMSGLVLSVVEGIIIDPAVLPAVGTSAVVGCSEDVSGAVADIASAASVGKVSDVASDEAVLPSVRAPVDDSVEASVLPSLEASIGFSVEAPVLPSAGASVEAPGKALVDSSRADWETEEVDDPSLVADTISVDSVKASDEDEVDSVEPSGATDPAVLSDLVVTSSPKAAVV